MAANKKEKSNQPFSYNDISKRVEELRLALGYKKKKEFCSIIGISESTYAGITGKKGAKPNIDLVLAVARSFPNANIHWVITGKGEKLLDNPEEKDEETKMSVKDYLVNYYQEMYEEELEMKLEYKKIIEKLEDENNGLRKKLGLELQEKISLPKRIG